MQLIRFTSALRGGDNSHFVQQTENRHQAKPTRSLADRLGQLRQGGGTLGQWPRACDTEWRLQHDTRLSNHRQLCPGRSN